MAKVVDGKKLLTYSDYVDFPEDGKRHEIIGGLHYVTPSPVTRHQRISRRIQFQLYRQIEEPGLGEVFDAPMDLLLSDIDIVKPDLIVVLEKNSAIITPKNLSGVPDFVVEITSPSTEKQDLDLKKSLYQSHGVAEYWIVLSDDNVVEKWVLEGGVYRLDGREAREVRFAGLPGVSVVLGEVWKD